jgi:hypothetical protein
LGKGGTSYNLTPLYAKKGKNNQAEEKIQSFRMGESSVKQVQKGGA